MAGANGGTGGNADAYRNLATDHLRRPSPCFRSRLPRVVAPALRRCSRYHGARSRHRPNQARRWPRGPCKEPCIPSGMHWGYAMCCRDHGASAGGLRLGSVPRRIVSDGSGLASCLIGTDGPGGRTDTFPGPDGRTGLTWGDGGGRGRGKEGRAGGGGRTDDRTRWRAEGRDDGRTDGPDGQTTGPDAGDDGGGSYSSPLT